MFFGVPLPTTTPWADRPARRLRRPGDPPSATTILALALAALTVLAILAGAVLTIEERAALDPMDLVAVSPGPDALPEAALAGDAPDGERDATVSTAYPADPVSIPATLLTRLEAASDAPLATELSLLLQAIQSGFGASSAQLEPTLRSYAYRMSSRFEWNPDAYQIAVTAPDAALAEARAAMLNRLFQNAVSSGRLQIRAAVGPHALSLVTE